LSTISERGASDDKRSEAAWKRKQQGYFREGSEIFLAYFFF
jgi:hypothetical protein